MVFLVLLLAAVNIGLSLVDPIIFGRIIDFTSKYNTNKGFMMRPRRDTR